MDAAMKLSEAVIGSVIAVAAFVIGVPSTAAVYCCVVLSLPFNDFLLV